MRKISKDYNINKILETFNNIINEYSQAVDTFSNVDFKDGVVGSSRPSKDGINPALLQDVQTAAKNAGVQVDITTAVSGHKKGTRHESGNAVDIAIINGKAVSKANRSDADKFVKELINLGYVKNSERGNQKAVLTFGFKNHDNHVHVSNNGQSSSTPSSKSSESPEGDLEYDEPYSVDSSKTTSDNNKEKTDKSKSITSPDLFLNKFKTTIPGLTSIDSQALDLIGKGFGLKENKNEIDSILETFNNILNINESTQTLASPLDTQLTVTSPFGKKRSYEIHPGVDLRARQPQNVKSPLDGKITVANMNFNSKCGGTVDIQHADGLKTRFCHISRMDVKVGDIVKQGQVVGLSGGDASDPGRGNSKQRHLHWTLLQNGKKVDPMQFLGKKVSLSPEYSSSSTGDDVDDVDDEKGTIEDKTTKTTTSGTSSSLGSFDLNNFVYDIIKKSIGLKEEKVYSDFGRETKNRFGTMYISKEKNDTIKSPVDGIVNNIRVNTSCKNQITIQFEIDDKTYFLQFCGITNPSIKNGQIIKKGIVLGKTSEDVTATLYNTLWEKQYIDIRQEKSQTNRKEEEIKKKKEEEIKKKKEEEIKKKKEEEIKKKKEDGYKKNKKDDYKYKKEKENKYKNKKIYDDEYEKEIKYRKPEVRTKAPLAAGVIDLLTYPFRDKYDKEGKRVQKRWAYPTEKEQPGPFIKDFFKKYSVTSPKKVNEDIERIKRLLK